jgi:uncharacterized membrane protein YkgB
MEKIATEADCQGPDARPGEAGVVIGQIQLILAEKRTSLAVLRTGIAVFVLPLSVLSVLVTTSKYYSAPDVLHFLVPLLGFSGILAFLGVYLIFQAMVKIRRFDRQVREIKARAPCLSRYIDPA